MTAFVLIVLLFWPVEPGAQEAPRPPCGAEPEPPYAAPMAPPNVRVWSDGAMGARWVPPACLRWTAPGFQLLVALAASFRYDGGTEDLLARIGAISQWRSIRYWSTTDKDWRVLITDAAALDGPDSKRQRPDFTAAEMMSGRDLYFTQDDSRSWGEVIYRMRVRQSSADRLAIEVENVDAVRAFLVTLFGPGDLQSLYFLERKAPSIWGFYSLSRTGQGASSLAAGHEASYVNRAIASFRYVAGIPSDLEPPAAP